MLNRRQFSLAALAAPLAARAQTKALSARIKIDTERVVGAIDPKIYGNFAEHLGRCIEGGIFEEGSPLADAHGYRKDVMTAIKDLSVTQMRWPGGNFASNYNWRDGIGPRDQRPARLEMAWATTESNRFGTHEFLDYSEMMGFEPYVCANLGTGSMTEAQQWVEYCNSSEPTAMVKLRKANGRDKPWGVKYWGLGNEMDGPWQMGHRSAEDYGKFALEAAKLMKWTDPTVQLIAAGSSNFGGNADWVGWNRTVLQYLKDHIEYLSLHMYVGNAANDYYEFLARSVDMDSKIKVAAGIIQSTLATLGKHKPIYIAFDEWNVWYRARGNNSRGRGRNALEERYNLEDALSVATMLNTFVNNADTVKIANMAQIVNVIAPIFTDKKSLFLQTIYYPLQLFAANARGMALQTFVDGPGYESKQLGKVGYLDVSCAYDKGKAVLNVVNRHLDQDIEIEVEAQDKSFRGRYAVATVNGPEIKAENDFGVTKVKTESHKESAGGHKLKYRVPAHSFVMIQADLA